MTGFSHVQLSGWNQAETTCSLFPQSDVAHGADCSSSEYLRQIFFINIIGNSDTVYPKKGLEGKKKVNDQTPIKYNAISFSLLHESKIFFPSSYFLRIIGFETIVTRNAEISNANLKCHI